MNIGIISQDYESFLQIEENIQSCFKNYILQKYKSFKEFFMYKKSFEIDCLFIDVDLDKWSSYTKEIKDQFQNLKIIFFGTSYNQIYQSFDIEHLAFLSKEHLNEIKVLTKLNEEKKDIYFQVPFNGKNRIIKEKDVLYFKRDKRKTYVYMNNGDIYETYKHIDEYEKESNHLIRIHIKYLINPYYIKQYTYNQVTLKNDIDLSISRKYQHENEGFIK